MGPEALRGTVWGEGGDCRALRRVHAVWRSCSRQRTSMPQAIAHPIWKMIWTTGPTSLCVKF